MKDWLPSMQSEVRQRMDASFEQPATHSFDLSTFPRRKDNKGNKHKLFLSIVRTNVGPLQILLFFGILTPILLWHIKY